MPTYTEIQFEKLSTEHSNLVIALFSEIGFEGFDESGEVLKAFIPNSNFDEVAVQKIVAPLNLAYTKTFIDETNWNSVWESNFVPIVIDDFVAVRADFHDPIKSVMHEIIITPKMSFGTGHHATTYMMLQEMRNIDFKNKKVCDFGTGTGILAILAEKLGASRVLAIDNDDWSIENSKENFERNNCMVVEILKAASANIGEEFDIILANINKNVLMSNMEVMGSHLNLNGSLLLSGILDEDLSDILGKSQEFNLRIIHKNERSNWLILKVSH